MPYVYTRQVFKLFSGMSFKCRGLKALIELKRANDSSVATLRRGYSYNEVKAYAFLRFTRMVNISGAGIGVSE